MLSRVLPFDDGVTVHRALGAVLALAAVGHASAHVCGYRCGLQCAHNAFYLMDFYMVDHRIL